MIFDYVLVFLLTLLAGALSIPAGLQFGLDPIGVFVAATIGSLGFMSIVLLVGKRVQTFLFTKVFTGLGESVEQSRANDIVNRWGVVGLATIGGLVLGPTLTLGAALLLGVDLGRFAIWYSISTVVGFALLTVLWSGVL
jgi:hypothetical protein